MSRLRTASPYVLGVALILAGLNHFLNQGFYEPLIPGWVGSPRFWVVSSGFAEIAVGALVLPRRTRVLGATLAALLLIAVFPGNLTQAVNAEGGLKAAIAYLRLPLQVPLIWWALSVRRDARDRARAGASDGPAASASGTRAIFR